MGTTSIGKTLESIKTTVESGTGTAGTTVGALTDVAADTTDVSSVIALLRQIAEAVNNGSGASIATNKSLVDYIGAASTSSLVARLGALADAAADTASTATIIALLRQIAEAINNGSGASIGTNKSVVDLLGTNGTTITDVATSVLGAIGADNADNAFASTSVVANANGSLLERLEYVQALLDARAIPRIARKIVTFVAGSTGALGNHVIFTVTGAVKVRMYAVCTTNVAMTGAGATISLGIVGTVEQFIAATAGDALDAGELWFDASPTTLVDLDCVVGGTIMQKTAIGDGTDIIYTIAVDTLASGVVEFMAEYEPITTDGAIVAE